MPADWFPNTHSQICAVILAATPGSRLFPMTSSETPKHLLPVAGIPAILRLLECLATVPRVVICIAADDKTTLPILEQVATLTSQQSPYVMKSKSNNQDITVIKIGDDCFGSIDALRKLEQEKVVPESCHMIVLPGDLVVLQPQQFLALLQPSQDKEAACTTLLVDVGEQDEHGIPLKESAKSKKGGLARDVDDIEYIGLSYPLISNGEASLPNLVLKRFKMDVEADDMTGTAPKLELPKPRMRQRKLVVRTDWNDVHVYVIAPWVRQLLVVRKSLVSIQGDLLPLLISRQFQGKKATFGSSLEDEAEDSPTTVVVDENPYSVLATVVPNRSVLRANTIPSYLFACKEAVANGASLTMPPDAKWNGHFQSLVLEGATLGAKLTMKSSTIGKNCEIGAKCRLNNVVVMENAKIGENCSLQNTIVGPGATLGNNCSLNDCQVGPGKQLVGGTKEKGESFMVGDTVAEL